MFPLGELMDLFYTEYLELYGDPDVASVATAATINGMLAKRLPVVEVASELTAIEQNDRHPARTR